MLMPSPAFATQLPTLVTQMAPQFVHFCSHLAPAMSVLLCAAPLPTIRQIAKNQDVGSLPLLPYSCMAASCTLWTTYGLLRNEFALWAPNLVGLILALYYCSTFIKFAPKQASPTLPGSVKQHVTLLGVMGATTAAAVLTSVNPTAIGQAAVLLCIALFASPLASLKTVMNTKSASAIPLPFTLASVAACFMWSVTGLLELHDPNVIVPNTLGLVFGLAQVSLKLKYGNGDDFESQQLQQGSSPSSSSSFALTTP